MELYEIKNIDDAVEVDNLIRTKNTTSIFRGHACEAYHLIPSIARSPGITDKKERSNLEEFKKILNNNGYFKQNLEHNDFRILGLTQHVQKFPTRLLDWTSSILIALYFVCEDKKKYDQDGVIWLFPLPCNSDSIWLTSREEKEASPFSFDEFKIFICGSFIDDYKMLIDGIMYGNKRADVQRSVMTLHPKREHAKFANFEELKQKYSLKKFIIPRDCKGGILEGLSKELYRITNETLFRGVSPNDLRSKEKWQEITAKVLSNRQC